MTLEEIAQAIHAMPIRLRLELWRRLSELEGDGDDPGGVREPSRPLLPLGESGIALDPETWTFRSLP